jgi:outer membrane lipoprotein-sorting protein
MSRRLQPMLALAPLAFALLVGCGYTPPEQVAPPEPEPMPVAPTPAPDVAPEAQREGARLLQGLRQAFLACKGIEADVTSYSEGRFKAGKPVSELRTNRSTSKLIWAKPNRMRGEITKTDNFLVSGARMVSTDGKTITVRAGGVLGILPLKVSASDYLLASNRNHRFSDMTPNALLTWIMGPQAVWTVMGDSRVNGTPVKLVKVTNIKHLDKGITEERIAIDPATFAVRNLAMYEQSKKVVDYTFVKFRWNPTVSSETFKL